MSDEHKRIVEINARVVTEAQLIERHVKKESRKCSFITFPVAQGRLQRNQGDSCVLAGSNQGRARLVVWNVLSPSAWSSSARRMYLTRTRLQDSSNFCLIGRANCAMHVLDASDTRDHMLSPYPQVRYPAFRMFYHYGYCFRYVHQMLSSHTSELPCSVLIDVLPGFISCLAPLTVLVYKPYHICVSSLPHIHTI